jgi:hypothetical protein
MQRGSIVIAGLLLASAACAHGRRTATDAGEPIDAAQGVRVHVTNHYKTEMEIYATGSGTTQRLGLVAPGLEREFALPRVIVLAGSVTFTAHASGHGPLVQSDELRVSPGDIVDFDIATNLIGSQASVRT